MSLSPPGDNSSPVNLTSQCQRPGKIAIMRVRNTPATLVSVKKHITSPITKNGPGTSQRTDRPSGLIR